MCVDFTDLNKACPKNLFPMPQIDQLVDTTVDHPRMSFLDTFQGYHQIPLALDDQEKIAFVTPVENYHYKVMSFGLKNAGSTYQWMMTKMFEPQLGKSIEIYIDDMVVKSKVVSKHVEDLTNIFEILKEHKLRLNVSKCSFGVGLEKFLGYMVTHKGIEVNPDQIKAINNLQPPRNPKEVQKLIGMMATLNRFISRSTNRCRSFSFLLHKWKDFGWTEVRYLPLEKTILVVVHATRKLPHYFHAHTVVVLT